jgi:hypothetical protein
MAYSFRAYSSAPGCYLSATRFTLLQDVLQRDGATHTVAESAPTKEEPCGSVPERSAVTTRVDLPETAGRGLLESGYVVAVLRNIAEIDMKVIGDDHFIAIAVPGNPCGALLCCSEQGALALVKQLSDGLELLWTRRDKKTAT